MPDSRSSQHCTAVERCRADTHDKERQRSGRNRDNERLVDRLNRESGVRTRALGGEREAGTDIGRCCRGFQKLLAAEELPEAGNTFREDMRPVEVAVLQQVLRRSSGSEKRAHGRAPSGLTEAHSFWKIAWATETMRQPPKIWAKLQVRLKTSATMNQSVKVDCHAHDDRRGDPGVDPAVDGLTRHERQLKRHADTPSGLRGRMSTCSGRLQTGRRRTRTWAPIQYPSLVSGWKR